MKKALIKQASVIFVALICAIPLLSSPAMSATINVTASATDTLNGANGQCSLREAIANINNATTTYADCPATGVYGVSNTINIPAGTYTTSIAGSNEDFGASGDYDILRNVSIVGAGANLTTVNGNGSVINDRVFHIPGAYTVSISGVTVTGGNIIGASGGGISNSGTLTITSSTISANTSATTGGGVYMSAGTLNIATSTISGNTSATSGGGIYINGGTLTVTGSTVSGNTATTLGGGGIFNLGGAVTLTGSTINGNTATAGNGGGINNWNTATITNSTITGNTATLDGGGIYDKNVITVTNATISANSASGVGGGVAKSGGGVSVFSSAIVAMQTLGADCSASASLTSSGYNLDSDNTCGFGQVTDKHTDPLLGALANNGGSTFTMLLQSGSPAIDAGPATCAAAPVNAVDQRGTARPQGAGCDIGAYEGGLPAYMVSASSGTGGTVTPTSQRVVSGSTASFTLAASAGYTISPTVGGTCVAGLWTGAVYTTGAVTAACSVSFTFTGPPSVTTGTATSIAQAGATLNALVDPKNVSTTVTFEYGLTNAYGSTAAGGTLTGGTALPATGQLTGLVCGTTYYYRATAVNASGTTNGTGRTFITAPCLAPLATTGAATNIMQTGVTFTGKVDPKKATTTVTFEYGLTSSYGASVSGITQTGNVPRNVSASATGLVCGSTYHYRIVAANFNGPAYGTDSTFKTLDCLVPGVTTGGVRNIMQTSVTLTGLVNPQGASTTVTFEYGPDSNYGTTVSRGALIASRPRPVSAQITGLTCDTVYHFKVAALNANGPGNGINRAFKTASCLTPGVATEKAINIGPSMATFTGKVNPNKALATVSFEYGLTTAYGATVSAGTLTGETIQPASAQAVNLACATTYHFRIVAVNSNGSVPGADRVFRTTPCPAYDFGGDGKSDILLRDAVTGQPNAWMMNGVTVTLNAPTSLSAGAYTSTSGLLAQGIGDFDGDSKYDILWRDAVSGQLTIWTMNGAVAANATASMFPGPYTSSTGLHVQGIGDFNGDGKSDILFRDAGTGQTSVWIMNGSTVTVSTLTNVQAGLYTATSGYQVHGVADFNGDGKADILWRHAGTGKTSIWFMNGANKTGGGFTTLQPGLYAATTGWQVHGLGDFNGDKKSDILWRHAITGETSVWFMNGANKTGGGATSLQPGVYTSTTGWQIQGVGDYNGDGKSDILYRYAGTGETFIWLMNGATVVGDWTSVTPGAYTSTTGLQIVSEETIR
ncbi:MAG: VCBS repeat-containing protein [Nitrospinae bacterium]|nr:VCBS repeat-containing protein [Nitrospinota bacterium]